MQGARDGMAVDPTAPPPETDALERRDRRRASASRASAASGRTSWRCGACGANKTALAFGAIFLRDRA